MIKVTLGDRKKYDLNGLKRIIQNFGELYLLGRLANGDMSYFFLHKKNKRYNLRYLIKKIEKQKQMFDSSEEKWFKNLIELQDQLNSFDENYYRSLDKKEKSIYTTKYGLKCAQRLEPLVKGYVNKEDEFCPACPNAKKDATWEKWKKLISPIDYFVSCSKAIYIKNNKSIKMPLDLNIID